MIEIEPLFEEPNEERALLACEPCRLRISGKRDPRSTAEVRFLEQAIWSETLPAQLTAVRFTRLLAKEQVVWAVDALDALWLPEELESLVQ